MKAFIKMTEDSTVPYKEIDRDQVASIKLDNGLMILTTVDQVSLPVLSVRFTDKSVFDTK